jgi:hypothetical protein
LILDKNNVGKNNKRGIINLKSLKEADIMDNTTGGRANDIMTKEQFSQSFIQALKHGANIAAGKEKTADARDFIKQVRAEIEEDQREGR